MICPDCGSKDWNKNWAGTICPECWDWRMKFVEAMNAKLIGAEELSYIQKGRYTRRGKIKSVLANVVPFERKEEDG